MNAIRKFVLRSGRRRQISSRVSSAGVCAGVLAVLGFLILVVQATGGIDQASVPAQGPARLIRSGSDSIEFEVVSEPPQFVPVKTAAGNFEVLSIPGYFPHGRAGEAELPHRTFLVGIPPGAGYEVSVFVVEERSLEAKRLAPSPVAYDDGTNGVQFSAVPSRTYYESESFTPSSPLLGTGESWLRGQRVLGIDVCPVRYRPASGTVVFFPRLKVKVALRPGAGEADGAPERRSVQPGAGDALEAVFETTLLNYEQA
ncbi:MAG: C25 family peptidase propeptide domain-containing protein, partial [Candidatus Eisenbacteria bacterium]